MAKELKPPDNYYLCYVITIFISVAIAEVYGSSLEYRHTLLQIGVSAQLYFLFAPKGHLQATATVPKQVGLVELLSYWLHHQLGVVERRLSFELRQFKTRLATVEALIIGATHAQELVKIFQEADGKAAAKAIIQKKYSLSEEHKVCEIYLLFTAVELARKYHDRALGESRLPTLLPA